MAQPTFIHGLQLRADDLLGIGIRCRAYEAFLCQQEDANVLVPRGGDHTIFFSCLEVFDAEAD